MNLVIDINTLFSRFNPQTLNEDRQNDLSTISSQTAWLNASSNNCSTINHEQCPTCLRPFSVTETSEGNQQHQTNSLLGLGPLLPPKSLQTPEPVQYGYGMTSAGGDSASSKPLVIQQRPIIQSPQVQSPAQDEQDTRALHPATTQTRNRSKSKSTPKQYRRKSPNAKCEVCDRSFTRVYDLQRHWLSLHTGQLLRWTCAYCDGKKSFCREEKLKKHLRDHHPEFDMGSLGA